MSAANPAPTVSTPVGAEMADKPTTEVRDACFDGMNGDAAARRACVKAILVHAEATRVDQLDPEFKSSCLVIPRVSYGDLVWKYVEWLGEHPDAEQKPASTTINAAMLDKLPCGWTYR
ncbi:Rap1a/Tai family immunity protein [Sphingosinicella sp. BN140058]|uniref:Rap1a/Tai family immunity protein n=1 Tax=Sphingosinicella sp. BN140058 TaxID=1892855 RepID=UPI001010C305|nr:Rap1a/Tai family immunity protein [Sphingosinicella sp. BN140058]QAY80470.1 hypothetical protein ETR14_27925 [Sphingosinicella sp. BN140058]